MHVLLPGTAVRLGHSGSNHDPAEAAPPRHRAARQKHLQLGVLPQQVKAGKLRNIHDVIFNVCVLFLYLHVNFF